MVLACPTISVGNLARGCELPIPPLDEQRRITAHLDEQTANTDALIIESKQFIELSLERRTALISAAATGQVDVREGGVMADHNEVGVRVRDLRAS